MPPKAAGAEADTTSSVVALCHLMATCTEFKADTSQMATVLNISHAKNVPRKINGIINPHGFEFRGAKVYPIDGDASAPATPTKSAANGKSSEATTPKTSTNVRASKKVATPKTPAGKKVTTPKTPASKKRKMTAIEDGSDAQEDIKDTSEDDSSKDGKHQERSTSVETEEG